MDRFLRYVVRVLITVLLIAMFAAPLAAQTPRAASDWPAYLPPEEQREAERWVGQIELADAFREQAVLARYDRLTELTAAARENAADRVTLAADIELALRDPSDITISAAREGIRLLLETSPPTPGTRDLRLVRQWLASHTSLPISGQDILATYDEFAQDLGTWMADVTAMSLALRLSVADVLYPEAADPADLLGERIELYALRTLAQDSLGAAGLVRDLVNLIRDTDSSQDSATAVAPLLVLADRLDVANEIADRTPDAAVVASVGPELMADVASAENGVVRAIGSFLRAIAVDASASARAYRFDAAMMYVTDVLASLLQSASDLELYLFSQASGVGRSELSALVHSLHATQRLAAPSFYADANGTAFGSAPFVGYLDAGEEALAAAEPWVQGELSRSGDAYRWAMISLLNHAHAQSRLVSDPELELTRELLGEFLDATLREAARVSGVASFVYTVPGVETQPFLRVIRARSVRDGRAFASAIARIAQGRRGEAPELDDPYRDGLTLGEYWCLTHGIVVIDEATLDAAGPLGPITVWFEVAADTVDDEISMVRRGLALLRYRVREQTDALATGGALSPGQLSDLYSALVLIDRGVEGDPRHTAEQLNEGLGTQGSDFVIALGSRIERYSLLAERVTGPNARSLR